MPDLFGGNWPRAVGKRTPRFPVPFGHDNNGRSNIISPKRHDLNFKEDAATDEGVHGAVLALAEASQRGRPSQISETCDRKAECVGSSSMWSGKTGVGIFFFCFFFFFFVNILLCFIFPFMN